MNLDPGKPATLERNLGIHVRPRSIGFVVIEDRAVLDCGARSCDLSQFDDCLGERFLRILRTYGPSVVIVLGPGRHAERKKRSAVTNAIRTATRKQNISMVHVSQSAVRRYFRPQNAATKYEIAQAVAIILPELGWQLPAKRKPWQSEHHRMTIFDAAAAVITHTML